MSPAPRPSGVGPILTQLFRDLGLEPRLREQRVFEVWTEAVGDPVARHVQPAAIRDGLLFLTVDTSAWMQQLQFMKELLRTQLNQKLDGEIVREIYFKLGPAQPSGPRPRREPAPPWLQVALSEEELGQVERELQAVREPGVRDALRKLRLQARRLEKFYTGRS
ncbi:MAG: DUF721 domain-containing protein [Deltaproteobacteria bacterium]|nr:DUF721 domain-containing protein [Deltaproteobacteria bacterium]MBI3076635.1 DUF721 domain-containing protein [Deltaproteobacteria bacterium]